MPKKNSKIMIRLTIITLLVITGVLLFNNSVYAKPENTPEIVSFVPSEEYTKCISLVWNSKSSETIEVMNNTTQRLYKFEGATGYTFQGLTKDKTYEVMIRSCDRVDNLYDCTNWSPVKSATAKEIIYNIGNVVLSNTNFIYDGKVKKPTAIVKNDKNVTLKEGTDYKITYPTPNTINKGTYKVVVTGLGNYKFTKELIYKILPAGVKSITLSKTSYTYDGKVKKPSVKVINNKGTTLVKNKDYTITYPGGRTNVGTYTVKVKGKGNYSFNKSIKFKIKAPEKIKSTKITSTSVTKSSIRIKYSSVSGASYQIGYKKSSASNYKNVNSNSTSYKIENLKEGTKYKVKVRAFKKVGKMTIYSEWSPVKTIETDIDAAELIARTAEELAWPYGTSEKIWHHNYSSGIKISKWSQLGTARPTKAFQDAYDKVRPGHFKSGGVTSIGADCGVFVNTVLKYSGHDPKMKYGEMDSYFKRKSTWKKVSSAKRGDVCITRKHGFHVRIYLGNNRSAEAGHYTKRFGKTSKANCSGYSGIWRAVK